MENELEKAAYEKKSTSICVKCSSFGICLIRNNNSKHDFGITISECSWFNKMVD